MFIKDYDTLWTFVYSVQLANMHTKLKKIGIFVIDYKYVHTITLRRGHIWHGYVFVNAL